MKRINLLTLVLSMFICSLTQAQIYFADNFEQGISNWTNHDLDQDGKKWETYDFSAIIPFFGKTTLISFSKDLSDVEYDPDHLFVSQEIDLTQVTAENIILRFDGIADYTLNENYAIYVTTSNAVDDIINSTPFLQEETTPEFVKELDFSQYKGQKVYLSFRHFNSKAKGYLGIDNVEIKTPQENYVQIQDNIYDAHLLVGQKDSIYFVPQNNGTNTITSLKVSLKAGDQTFVETMDIQLAPNSSGLIGYPKTYKFDEVGKHKVTLSIDEVNGQANTNPDAAVEYTVWAISKSGKKVVFLEESTGTWCGFCPRGEVALAKIDAEADDICAAVAVHVRDTMEMEVYADRSSFAGAPSMHIDRTARNINVDDKNIVEIVKSFAENPCPADFSMTGTISGQDVQFDLSSTFYTNFDKNELRYGIVLYENGVTGKGPAFAQANYFSGTSTKMAGYENKPNPVPADSMVYDHVARVLIGGYDGQEGSIPTSITDGKEVSYTFNYSFADDAKIGNFVAVGIIIDAQGHVLNASKLKLQSLTSTTMTKVSSFELFPNPATDYIQVAGLDRGKYTLQIFNMSGQLMQSKTYQVQAKDEHLTHQVHDLQSGNYVLSLVSKNSSMSKIVRIK